MGKQTKGAKTPKVPKCRQFQHIKLKRRSTAVVVNPRKLTARAPKIRSTITPGTILILVVGPYQGKRVVCLKALPSGLIAVTGPLRINGVPLRRVNQRHLIATSTKIDVSGVDTNMITDEYFSMTRKERRQRASKHEDDMKTFIEQGKKTRLRSSCPEEKKKVQADIDSKLAPQIEADDVLKFYLKTKFELKNGDAPHRMKF